MKRVSRLFLGVLSVIALCVLSSCEKEEKKEYNEDEVRIEALKAALSEAKVELVSEEKYTLTEMADLLYGKPNSDLVTLKPDDAREQFIKRNQAIIDSYKKDTGGSVYSVYTPFFHSIKYRYTSTDQKGRPIELSAYMVVGSYMFDFTDQNHIYLICPYTHTKEDECATKDELAFEKMTFLSIDNLFIMPDGQGFGADAGNVQPYIDHNTQAKQLYDALIAGFHIYTEEYNGEMEGDWTLRVIGASQGAGDAMAVHKYLDTNGRTVKWPAIGDIFISYGAMMCFEYSYVCSGPYDPVSTLESYYSIRELEFPCVIPLVIKSMLECNPELSKKYDESNFYSAAYNQRKAEYDMIYRDKTMKTSDLNKKLAEDLNTEADKKILSGDDHVFIDRILCPSVLDKNSQIYKDFMACLKKQDLTTGWKPKTKTFLYASNGDKTVPPINTTKLAELFISNGTSCEVDWEMTDQGHIFTCGKFMLLPW